MDVEFVPLKSQNKKTLYNYNTAQYNIVYIQP